MSVGPGPGKSVKRETRNPLPGIGLRVGRMGRGRYSDCLPESSSFSSTNRTRRAGLRIIATQGRIDLEVAPRAWARRPIVNIQEYRENRARFSFSELKKYRGQWVAFSQDGLRIVASSDDLTALDQLVTIAGEDPERVALERIAAEDVYLGAAEQD